MSPIVVLASQSPNRLALLQKIGIEPIVHVSDFEENLSKELPVREFVEKTAEGKLEVVLAEKRKKNEPFDVIIAADTVIWVDGKIIGKPEDRQNAIETLKSIRKRGHFVYSGVALAYRDGSTETFSVETEVHMANYSDQLIEGYVATGEPMNKAGSYGIQNRGAVLVERLNGCFYNVVGLPLAEIVARLSARGIPIFC
ncbi:unnamed protein product, partial [Mesorhabditis spiculigera]